MAFKDTMIGIGSGVSAITGIGQAFFDSYNQKVNTDKTIEANKRMAEYAYSKDLEMWNRSNEYNSPQSQMDRLTKAKLNPNLVYGNGAVANTAGQLPKYNAPTQNYNYQAPQVFDKLGQWLNLTIQQQQSRKLEEEIRGQQLNNALAVDMNYYRPQKLFYEKELLKHKDDLATWNKEMLEPYYTSGSMSQSFGEGLKKSLLSNEYLRKQTQNLSEIIKGTVLKNSLLDQQKLNYQASYKGQMMSNDIREIERNFMRGMGIHSTKDILPLFQFILSKIRK